MACVQNYDGTSWSEGTVINTARMGASFAGVQNAGIIYGGNPYSPQGVCTEEWNGSAWTEVNDLNNGRNGLAGAGTAAAAIAAIKGKTNKRLDHLMESTQVSISGYL